jgi:hypothetical protein
MMIILSSARRSGFRGLSRVLPIAVMLLYLMAAGPAGSAEAARGVSRATTSTIHNDDATGQISRFDLDGNSLDAHDGSMLQVGNVFYLYGTSYSCGYQYQQNSSFCGFKAYSSTDLVHWTDRGYITAPGACSYCFRPHVVFNARTRQYVMWADGGGHYIVATSPTPTGIFTRQADPTLTIGGAVDESLFVDDDGTGYVIHNTVQVEAGLTADMVVEKLTPDFLTTSGQAVRLGLGDVEAFTVFKRDGTYHALMSDPSCAYCSGATGEMTATSMLGSWSGAWYDPDGVHQSGRAEPRWRARIVNATNCGGQPLASIPITVAGSTSYYFVSDRWNHAANEGLANLYFGPMTFDGNGVLQNITCSDPASVTVPGATGQYADPPDLDQSSGFDGFHHYCDLAGKVERQQRFVSSRSGVLSTVSVTTFQNGKPDAPLTLEVVDASTGVVLSHDELPAATVPWAPAALVGRPGIAVTAGRAYLVRLSSSASSGCYGWEYNDSNPYASGEESYSVDTGASFSSETGRDLKFTTSVSADPHVTRPGVPPGFALCAGEAGDCTFTGTRAVAYGAGASANSYRIRVATGSINCGIVAFGADPAVGVLKSCYVAPLGGPPGYIACATEGGTCAVDGPRLVAYGGNGVFAYRLLARNTACTNQAFGSDPLAGLVKGCYLAPSGGPSGSVACATEGESCAGATGQAVYYGARGAFLARWVTGPITCSNAAFGGDPIAGVVKASYRPS